MPTYSGSPASATIDAVLGGLAELVDLAGDHAVRGSSPVVNLAIRTRPSLSTCRLAGRSGGAGPREATWRARAAAHARGPGRRVRRAAPELAVGPA